MVIRKFSANIREKKMCSNGYALEARCTSRGGAVLFKKMYNLDVIKLPVISQFSEKNRGNQQGQSLECNSSWGTIPGALATSV